LVKHSCSDPGRDVRHDQNKVGEVITCGEIAPPVNTPSPGSMAEVMT